MGVCSLSAVAAIDSSWKRSQPIPRWGNSRVRVWLNTRWPPAASDTCQEVSGASHASSIVAAVAQPVRPACTIPQTTTAPHTSPRRLHIPGFIPQKHPIAGAMQYGEDWERWAIGGVAGRKWLARGAGPRQPLLLPAGAGPAPDHLPPARARGMSDDFPPPRRGASPPNRL